MNVVSLCMTEYVTETVCPIDSVLIAVYRSEGRLEVFRAR